ncbi:MAG: hypothetical protein IKW00_02045 [Clostridia bacterium]|nr:hypothetical protein [Clostridia bacterium]
MKKRILCFFLCMMLVLPLAAQAKVFDYTISQLIARQLDAQSSLKVTVTAGLEGDAPAFADAQVWTAVKEALSSLELKATYFKSKSRQTAGNQQITLTLNQSGEALSALTLTGKGAQWFLESDLIPEKTVALSRDMKTAYMNLTRPQEGTWPNILRTLVTVYSADEDFAAQLDDAIAPHMTSLNKWLQGYTEVKMTSAQMTQEITVSAAALRKQIKKTLNEIYEDEALLALLRKVVPAQDAAAYLEKGMLPVFMQSLDAMQLEESIHIVRTYGKDGALKKEEITFPFAKGMGIEKIILVLSDKEKTADVVFENGCRAKITANGAVKSGNGTVKGEILMVTEPEGKAFEARYTLALTAGAEQYIEENKSRERDQKFGISLLLEPKEEGAFHAQKFTADLHLMAGASNTKPARIETDVVWEDTVSGGRINLHIKANTSSALHQSEADEANAAVLDTLSRADRETYLADVSAQLVQSLTALVGRILGKAD